MALLKHEGRQEAAFLCEVPGECGDGVEEN
jgi:hypothetical protein